MYEKEINRSYNLYTALGSLPSNSAVYVNAQDGHAYRVKSIRKDEHGDLIIETVERTAKVQLVKHD